jgi:hypothetical protein
MHNIPAMIRDRAIRLIRKQKFREAIEVLKLLIEMIEG